MDKNAFHYSSSKCYRGKMEFRESEIIKCELEFYT